MDAISTEPRQAPDPDPTPTRRRGLVALAIVVGGVLTLAPPVAMFGVAHAGQSELGAVESHRSESLSPGTGSVQTGVRAPATSTPLATADEATGVVLIETELGYLGARAAGTGVVLTSDGQILTNNHVVQGATEIRVTIAATGETYAADLVGSDVDDDVALLQLEGASRLHTVALDDDADAVGDSVTAVGNSEGQGALTAASGQIVALDAQVNARVELDGSTRSLDGMIAFAAAVVSGDSGGALLDAEGEVLGITTAASVGGRTTTGFAIPIETAMAIVQQVTAGVEADGVTLGYPAFLGVIMDTAPEASNQSGARISGALAETPAASAGMTGGDVVTALDGVVVDSPATLSALIAGYDPGDVVQVAWTDPSGASHTADVTLIQGPAA